jgi:glycosyltransferase involved in cell wall biosynthesis
MLSKYKIAVLIPTYNRAKLLSYTLESLQKQIVEKNNFQVVIADDGSFDNTRDVVQAFESKINLHYVWQEDRGYRPASARNLAINASDSEVCLFIDSGVLLQKDCLTRHIEFHEKAK